MLCSYVVGKRLKFGLNYRLLLKLFFSDSEESGNIFPISAGICNKYQILSHFARKQLQQKTTHSQLGAIHF